MGNGFISLKERVGGISFTETKLTKKQRNRSERLLNGESIEVIAISENVPPLTISNSVEIATRKDTRRILNQRNIIRF